MGEEITTQRAEGPLHAPWSGTREIRLRRIILAEAGIQRERQVAVPSHPREVQESISCRGLGGVPQFLFFFPQDWGT